MGDEIHVKRDINFGVAVSLGEGGAGGLVVPVIRQAQKQKFSWFGQRLNRHSQQS